jgi:hypothetical protein
MVLQMSKKTLNQISWLVLLVIALAYAYSTYIEKQAAEKQAQNQEEAAKWAKINLPQTGILKENNDGFVYLKVDDNYIHRLFPLLHLENYEEPPFFRRKDSPGAHISVFYTYETDHIGKIKELGQQFSFEIGHFKFVTSGPNKYLILTVSSPQLEELRRKYGFKPLLNGHDFHISIAKKNS